MAEITTVEPDGTVVIRCSTLSGYLDCPRRAAARNWVPLLEAAGFSPRQTPGTIGAAVGTAVHAGAARALQAKVETGMAAGRASAVDEAIATLDAELEARETAWDDVTPHRATAQRQVDRMVGVYLSEIVPKVHPLAVENRMEAVYRPGYVLSGQADNICIAPGQIRDTKTGKFRRPSAAQLGGYLKLARVHGHDVGELIEDYVARVGVTKPQPGPLTTVHDAEAASAAAGAILDLASAQLDRFRASGDPWAFPANPNSALCSDRYCPAWGTSFCKEWRR
jgi:hypothetical protein